MAWTDKTIRGLAPGTTTRREYERGSDPGLCVQITPAGTRTFQLQYSHQGRRRFFRLGTYPACTLAEARRRAREARTLIDQGLDPQEERDKTEREAKAQGTVALLLGLYEEELVRKGKRSARKICRSIERDAIPLIGDMPARDVKPVHIRQILRKILDRGAEVHAGRVRSYLMSMFRYGLHHDNDPRSYGQALQFGMEFNPVDAVPRDQTVERARDRVLSWSEILQWWDDDLMSPMSRLGCRLIWAMGGQRPGEIMYAPWSEIDMGAGVWLIPGARTKNKRDHILPLSPLALQVLEEVRQVWPGSVYLFPLNGNPASTRPCTHSIGWAVRMYTKRTGMEPWRAADLRRTWKTLAGELGVSKWDRDRVQNHTISDVSGRHYDRYSYLAEKRQALEAVSTHTLALLRGANVRAIRAITP